MEQEKMVVKTPSEEPISQRHISSQPSVSRPMQHASPPRPNRHKKIADARDVPHSTERSKTERDRSDSHSISADSDSCNDDDYLNHSVKEMETGLEIQKKKKGRHHACVTRSLHALALEYKSLGRYEKAGVYMNKAQNILDERLAILVAEVKVENESLLDELGNSIPIQDDGSQYGIIKMHSSKITRRYFGHLMEEKSVMYSCLANMYKMRGMHKEAMDNYVHSINMLVEADYPGDSDRVTMMVRMMKRTEEERKALGKTRTSKCDNFERCSMNH